MTTITKGATTLTPTLVTSYTSSRTSGNIIHDILGRNDPDVTLRGAGLRTGTLNFLQLNHASALALESLHASAGIFTLADTDLPGLNMKYVVNGSIGLTLDDETRLMWTVTVDYQEVL